MKKTLLFFLIIGTSETSLFAAGMSESSYRPTAQVLENDRREINEEDIRKAFEADPQIVLPLRVAWYNMGTDSIIDLVEITDFPVESRYPIPKTLIEGLANANASAGYYGRPTTLSLAALRLAAARAKCDLLVLVGSSCTVTNGVNILSIFNILLFPILFNPAFDVTVDYSTEMYVFDVRNEYLYGQYSFDSGPVRSGFLTLARRDKVSSEIKEELLNDAAAALSSELTEVIGSYVSVR